MLLLKSCALLFLLESVSCYLFKGHFLNLIPEERHYNLHIPDPITYSHPHDELIRRKPLIYDLSPIEDIHYNVNLPDRAFTHKHYRSPERPVHALYNTYPYYPLAQYNEIPNYRGVTYILGVSPQARITVPVCKFSAFCIQ